ncbi:MAG TPA: hypothetical protein PLF82_09425 [Halanaerobiales bacterium]|nr:hypothetical protein [Halanaerobiales bacterium]
MKKNILILLLFLLFSHSILAIQTVVPEGIMEVKGLFYKYYHSRKHKEEDVQ